jgi:hypothetical protein
MLAAQASSVDDDISATLDVEKLSKTARLSVKQL